MKSGMHNSQDAIRHRGPSKKKEIVKAVRERGKKKKCEGKIFNEKTRTRA